MNDEEFKRQRQVNSARLAITTTKRNLMNLQYLADTLEMVSGEELEKEADIVAAQLRVLAHYAGELELAEKLLEES